MFGIHDVFHVSLLRKYEPDVSHILDWQELNLQENMKYEERPREILDVQERVLRNKVIPLVKVLWEHHGVEEATWAKCYKLHGYPLGYKPKQTPTANVVVHQMKENVETPIASNGVSIAAAKENIVSLLQTLSTEQCQHLMAVLSSHLVSSVVTHDAPSTSCTTGICSSVSVQPSLTSMHWIMDSGASKHIFTNAKLFLSMRPIQSCAVTLPNKIIIPVHFSGQCPMIDFPLRNPGIFLSYQ